jgi:hypothetical protein
MRVFQSINLASPYPLLWRGFQKREVKVLSFGEDLGEARSNYIIA